MRNVPVIGKFLALMAMFAVFALGCIVYTTSQMSLIQKGYEAEENGPAAYAMAGVRSNGAPRSSPSWSRPQISNDNPRPSGFLMRENGSTYLPGNMSRLRPRMRPKRAS